MGAVSYTHLDVYKRQQRRNAASDGLDRNRIKLITKESVTLKVTLSLTTNFSYQSNISRRFIQTRILILLL